MPSQPCATCAKPFEPRRSVDRFCSAKCRLAAFKQKHEQVRQDRDARVRRLLREVLALLGEGHHDHIAR